jgi:hypothetical protein
VEHSSVVLEKCEQALVDAEHRGDVADRKVESRPRSRRSTARSARDALSWPDAAAVGKP